MTARTLIAGLEVFAVGIVESLRGQRVDREPDVDVLIVGAGPVGLTAAVELRRRGVCCLLIDELAAPAPWAKGRRYSAPHA